MASIKIDVPEYHPCYAHHFPDGALVPGALLLSWIAKKMRGEQLELTGVKTLKFLRPVEPGQQCVLKLDHRDTTAKISLTTSGKVVLKGSVTIKYVN